MREMSADCVRSDRAGHGSPPGRLAAPLSQALKQAAWPRNASNFFSAGKHGWLLASEEAPDFHDPAGSRRVTTEIAQRAICSHGNPPGDGPDLATVEAVYGEPAR